MHFQRSILHVETTFEYKGLWELLLHECIQSLVNYVIYALFGAIYNYFRSCREKNM